MANDYKPDAGKPPVMDAVFIPFRRTLLAVAAMMQDMKTRHQLHGAANPFEEWKKLPNGKGRLANASGRHILRPWEINTEDGTHLHAVHGLASLMMAVELHLAEQELVAQVPASVQPETDGPASVEVAYSPTAICVCGHARNRHLSHAHPICMAIDDRRSVACKCPRFQRARVDVPEYYWTDDAGSWRCTCAASRPGDCTCPGSKA